MMRKREPAAICMCTNKTLIITVIIFFLQVTRATYLTITFKKLTSVLEKWLKCSSVDQMIPASALDFIA